MMRLLMSDTVSVTENYGCSNGCQKFFHSILLQMV